MAVYQALLLNTVVPQIQAAQAGDSYVMVVNATTPALRITQTGTGNAISVEDEANPDATPFVVTAAGDVGIGTNAPSRLVDIEKNQNASTILRVGNTTSGTAAYSALQLTSSHTTYLYNFSNGYTTSGKFEAGVTLLDANGPAGLTLCAAASAPIKFFINSAESARITSGGNLEIANGNLVMSTSGKGIDFSATASGSGTMTSELLNDYEEGTWTPVLKFDTNTQTINIQAATYVKVGRAVTINMSVSWAAKSGSGRVYITGLPFAKENNATVGLLASCSAGSITTTAALFYNVDAGGSDLNLAEQSADIDSASLASSGQIACTGTYFV